MAKQHNKHIRTIHGLLRAAGLQRQKEALVMSHTHGRTDSLEEATEHELIGLADYLGKEQNERRRPMRSAILHKMGLLGYTLPDGTLDYERVNEYIIQIGSRNPGKVILNYLYYDELQAVLTQLEQRCRKEGKL